MIQAFVVRRNEREKAKLCIKIIFLNVKQVWLTWNMLILIDLIYVIFFFLCSYAYTNKHTFI